MGFHSQVAIKYNTKVSQLVSWCFKPSQPQRITLGLSITPRFLTESDKATDALPTVIESGKAKEREIWTFDSRIRSLLQSCRHLV